MYVILCRGDWNEAELEVFGPFLAESLAYGWLANSTDNCPNEHEVVPITPISSESLMLLKGTIQRCNALVQ